MWKTGRDHGLKVESCKVTPPPTVKAKLRVYRQASTDILEEIKEINPFLTRTVQDNTHSSSVSQRPVNLSRTGLNKWTKKIKQNDIKRTAKAENLTLINFPWQDQQPPRSCITCTSESALVSQRLPCCVLLKIKPLLVIFVLTYWLEKSTANSRNTVSFSLPAVKSSLGSSFFLNLYCVCLSSPAPCPVFLSPSLFLLPLSLGECNVFFLKSPLFPLSLSVCQLISALQTAYKTHFSAAILAESSRKVHILAKNPMNSTTYPKKLTDK